MTVPTSPPADAPLLEHHLHHEAARLGRRHRPADGAAAREVLEARGWPAADVERHVERALAAGRGEVPWVRWEEREAEG